MLVSASTMVREHRSQLVQLRGLADRDIVALLAAVDGLPVADVRDLLVETLPDLVAPYTTASGELAAVLFEDLRLEAGRRGTFYADVAGAVPVRERVSGTARWAVGSLVDETLGSTLQSRLAGSVARMIMDASRETMQVNGGRESVRFQRMARPGACAFCGMLASRPPWMSYRSSESAGGVVGRGVDVSANFNADGSQRLFGNRMAQGVKTRGSQNLGDGFHDDCQCVVMPLYPGTEMAELAEVEQKKWQTMYRQATNVDGKPIYDTKQILAEWRRYHGTK